MLMLKSGNNALLTSVAWPSYHLSKVGLECTCASVSKACMSRLRPQTWEDSKRGWRA